MDELKTGGTGSEANIKNLEECVELLRWAYEDSRLRSQGIRATALTAVGFLSLLGGLAGPNAVRGYGIYSIAGVVFLASGFVCAVAVLLSAPSAIPYDVDVLAADDFVKSDRSDRLRKQIRALHGAASLTTATNDKTGRIVNASLSFLVMSIAIFAAQSGLGRVRGLWAGFVCAVGVLGGAWLLYHYLKPRLVVSASFAEAIRQFLRRVRLSKGAKNEWQ